MLIELAIREVVSEQLVTQILLGGGGNEIQGIWGTTGVQNLDYGAGATDFDRDDVLDWFDNVRLAKSDGGMYTAVMGDGLWKLMEKTPRGTDGDQQRGLHRDQPVPLGDRRSAHGNGRGRAGVPLLRPQPDRRNQSRPVLQGGPLSLVAVR